MRKLYPYLEDLSFSSIGENDEKRTFLQEIDSWVSQKQYVNIVLLDWNENPLKEIQGELTSGSITKDGSSAVRRTASIACSVDGSSYDLDDADMDFAINKKIFLEIGIKNYSNKYKDYPILWFPQGVFFIKSFAINASATSSTNISLGLADKMMNLNGEIGGKFPATTQLDEVDTQTASGAYISEKIPIYNIIQELVNHFGGEDLNNIIIEDVPLRIKRIMKWTGSDPLYLIPQFTSTSNGQELTYEAKLEKPNPEPSGLKIITNGQNCGFIYDDFVLTKELTLNCGDTVCNALDKIKEFLGNYEYFYDEFGLFHFREIKNYLNKTESTAILSDMETYDYLIDITNGKSVYSFSDDENIISIATTPQYNNIKNDFVVQGKQNQTSTNIEKLVRYHLAIDRKPEVGHVYKDLLIYEENISGLVKAVFPLSLKRENLPSVGDLNIIYRISNENNVFLYWDGAEYKDVKDPTYYSSSSAGYVVKDWRTEIYLQGMLAKNTGTDAGKAYKTVFSDYSGMIQDPTWIQEIFLSQKRDTVDIDFYFEELEAFWPTIYDLRNQVFYGEQEENGKWDSSLAAGTFFLDFIDPVESKLGQFAVNNIGRRTECVNNNDINCIFEPEIPDIILLNIDDNENIEELRAECIENGVPYTQVLGNIYIGFATGGYMNPAYDTIVLELYSHTTYQKGISITAIPNFYLDVNTRVSINDKTTNTYGDYMITNITITLGQGSIMTVAASECIEKM